MDKKKTVEKSAVKSTKNEWTLFGVCICIAVIALVAVLTVSGPDTILITTPNGSISVKIDDWSLKYDSSEDFWGGISKSFGGTTGGYAPTMQMEAADGNLGFSVGGAKDIENFRANLEEGYFPLYTDITYEGLFYDYFFDTGKTDSPCEELFCPSYSYAKSKDPLSGELEDYLSVGLDSNIKESDFERKKLNLVVVLDISGSMGSPFDKYYYDQFTPGKEPIYDEDMDKSKMEIANEAVVELLSHLNDDDRFGMVVFDDTGYLAKPLSLVGNTDMGAIADHILELKDQGGTNMEAGMALGTEEFKEYINADKSEYENRIIFLTDAMPNTGAISEESLLGMTGKNADDGIYSTFIGIGVDFNTELIEAISKVKGANYYSVHSGKDFKERMDEGFEYMVTPLVFDLILSLDSDDYEIERVFGSPEADAATGEIMKVNTLFPSKSEGGEVKGGIIILKLNPLTDGEVGKATLIASYKDRGGQTHKVEKEIVLGGSEETYPNTGIEKGILLSRYTSVIKDWILDERGDDTPGPWLVPVPMPCDYRVSEKCGILLPPEQPTEEECPDCYYYHVFSPWERASVDLTVSPHYKEVFGNFTKYFESQMDILGDYSLEQEIDMLEILEKAPSTAEVQIEEYTGDEWLF